MSCTFNVSSIQEVDHHLHQPIPDVMRYALWGLEFHKTSSSTRLTGCPFPLPSSVPSTSSVFHFSNPTVASALPPKRSGFAEPRSVVGLGLGREECGAFLEWRHGVLCNADSCIQELSPALSASLNSVQ